MVYHRSVNFHTRKYSLRKDLENQFKEPRHSIKKVYVPSQLFGRLPIPSLLRGISVFNILIPWNSIPYYLQHFNPPWHDDPWYHECEDAEIRLYIAKQVKNLVIHSSSIWFEGEEKWVSENVMSTFSGVKLLMLADHLHDKYESREELVWLGGNLRNEHDEYEHCDTKARTSSGTF